MAKKVQVGDRVGYSAAFLRSTGQMAGDAGHARGHVTELKELSKGSTVLARIQWEGNHDLPGRVNVANLAKVGGHGWSTT